jgi:anti-sigma B factor antagonist
MQSGPQIHLRETTFFSVSAEESIQVGCLGSVAWVKVTGSANHESAPCIKEFLVGRFEKGWRSFVIDLADSKGIDSTFIGMLYRIATRISNSGEKGSVEIINPGERNAKSICKLGLDELIKIDLDGSRWERERALVAQNLEQPKVCPSLSKFERTEFVLDAHEALIAANEENRSRFCDVVEFLRQELEAQPAKR